MARLRLEQHVDTPTALDAVANAGRIEPVDYLDHLVRGPAS